MKQYRCRRCGHKWYPRKTGKPKICPNLKCHRVNWDSGRLPWKLYPGDVISFGDDNDYTIALAQLKKGDIVIEIVYSDWETDDIMKYLTVSSRTLEKYARNHNAKIVARNPKYEDG